MLKQNSSHTVRIETRFPSKLIEVNLLLLIKRQNANHYIVVFYEKMYTHAQYYNRYHMCLGENAVTN